MDIHFRNDLGIIPNIGTGLEENVNLTQGQDLMYYNRKYGSNKNCIEGLSERDEDRRRKGYDNSINKKVLLKKLYQYKELYLDFFQDYNIKYKQKNWKAKDYLNKIVLIDDTSNNSVVKKYDINKQEMYFVNNLGFSISFKNTPLEDISDKCNNIKQSVLSLNKEKTDDKLKIKNFKEFQKLTNDTNAPNFMKPNQPCILDDLNNKSAGIIVENKDKKLAWVDSYGIKHEFIDKKKMSNTCSEIAKISTKISNKHYNKIPSGPPMRENDICDIANILYNTYKWNNIINKDKEVVTFADSINISPEFKSLIIKNNNIKDFNPEEILDIINSLSKYIEKVERQISRDQEEKESRIKNNLYNEITQSEYKSSKGGALSNKNTYNSDIIISDTSTNDGRFISGKLKYLSNYLNFILWTIFTIIVIFTFSHYAINRNMNILIFTVFIISILISGLYLYSSIYRTGIYTKITRIFDYLLYKLFV